MKHAFNWMKLTGEFRWVLLTVWIWITRIFYYNFRTVQLNLGLLLQIACVCQQGHSLLKVVAINNSVDFNSWDGRILHHLEPCPKLNNSAKFWHPLDKNFEDRKLFIPGFDILFIKTHNMSPQRQKLLKVENFLSQDLTFPFFLY